MSFVKFDGINSVAKGSVVHDGQVKAFEIPYRTDGETCLVKIGDLWLRLYTGDSVPAMEVLTDLPQELKQEIN